MKQYSWVPIIGNVKMEDDTIELDGSVPLQFPNGTSQSPYSYVKSNIEFAEGIVSLEFFIENQTSACLVYFNTGFQMDLYAGINAYGAPFGFAIFRNGQWEPVAGSGHGSRLDNNVWHKLKIKVNGSIVDLFIDEVKVSTAFYRLIKAPIGLLLQGEGRVKVRNLKVEKKDPVCFVVMQFTDEYNTLYSEVIKPTCEAYGYSVVRADEYYNSGLIIDDITKSIRESALIIADITPDNPNVFYEVGFAHGIGKPTILLSDRKREKLPFDLSGFRTLFYDNSIGGKSIVEERLRKHLEAIIDQW